MASRWWRSSALLVGVLVSGSCSDDGPGGPSPITVTMTPGSMTIFPGETRAVVARKEVDGVVDNAATFSYTTSNSAVATVSTFGDITGVAAGTAEITATTGSTKGKTTVTVIDPAVGTITVALAHGNPLKVSDTVRATAVVRDAQGQVTPRPVTWKTNNPAVALVTQGGLVLGVSPGGPVTITAEAGGKSAAATLSVIPAGIGSITVSPASATLVIGSTVQLKAEVRDEFGAPVTDRPVVWNSLLPATASVSASGVVTAVAVGQTQVTATVGGVTKSVPIVVTLVPIAQFRIEVTNYLQFPLEISVNGVPVGMIAASDVGTVERPLLPQALVSWRLMTPEGLGEQISDTLGTIINPVGSSTFSYTVDNVLHDGTTYFSPSVRNLTSQKLLIDFPLRTDPARCIECISAPADATPRELGYWLLTPATTMRLYRSTDLGYTGAFLSIPVPAAAVAPQTGEWNYTVLVAP